jgi:hypothetical protein
MGRKIARILVVLALGMGLCTSGAWAYDYNPYSPVLAYQGSSPSTYDGWVGWFNIIGDSNYTIGGANKVSSGGQTYLDIYTGWGTAPNAAGGNSNGLSGNQYSEYGAIAADLTLYSNGKMWMVGLDSSRQGELFASPTYSTSIDLFEGNTSLIYGGAYNKSNPTAVPVLATGSGTMIPGLVSWSANLINGFYEVDVDLSLIKGLDPNHFSFVYPTATCANSVLTGCVPIPSSVLLLGSGLVGLAGLRRKWSLKK